MQIMLSSGLSTLKVRSEYRTQLANMCFGETRDLTQLTRFFFFSVNVLLLRVSGCRKETCFMYSHSLVWVGG